MTTTLNLYAKYHIISNFLTDLSSSRADPDMLELSEDPELILTSSVVEGSEDL